MKNSVVLLILSFISVLCYGAETTIPDYSPLAITKIMKVPISYNSFVVQVFITDLSEQGLYVEGFGLNGYTFTDNGKGNDEIANDGIFTSELTGNGNISETQLFGGGVIIDEEYSGKVSPTLKIKFHMVRCLCKTECTCPACEYWGWDCWYIEEWDLEIGIG
jgi:hypothetical protein